MAIRGKIYQKKKKKVEWKNLANVVLKGYGAFAFCSVDSIFYHD